MAYTNKTTRTQKKIQEALLSLMKEKKFEAITINDITEMAEINRSTFYRHYVDKYELLEKIEDTIFEDLSTFHKNILATIGPYELTRDFVLDNYVNGRNNFFIIFEKYLNEITILLSENGSITFRRRLTQKMISIFEKSFSFVKIDITLTQKELLFNFLTSIILTNLEYWTEHRLITADELFSFSINLVSNGVLTFVKDNMK